MRSRLLLPLLYPLLLAAQAPKTVVINEVLFWPEAAAEAPANHAWVELFNATDAPVDLAGWKISNRDGRDSGGARDLPSVILPPGAYLSIHFASGENDYDLGDNSGRHYTGDDPAASPFTREADEVALYSPDAIVDFLAWSPRETAYRPGAAHDAAVAAGIWTPNATLQWNFIDPVEGMRPHAVRPGTSVGRDAAGSDTNSPSDFDADGGNQALRATPAAVNFHVRGIVPIPDPAFATPAKNGARSALARKKWTILMYLSGDTNLEGDIYRNALDIQRAGGSTDDVNYVVLYDGVATSQLVRLDDSGEIVNLTPAGKTFRGRIGPHRSEFGDRLGLLHEPGKDPHVGELNMGDPATLRDFIAWARETYPAEKYGLYLGGHGLGWKGFGPDDSTPGSREAGDDLYMHEFLTALSGSRFDFIAFDACYMGAIEVAHQLESFSRWLIASEEIVPGPGFPWPAIAPALNENPDWDGEAVGRKMVEAFGEAYSGDSNWQSLYTLALIDMRAVTGLSRTVDTLAKALRTGVGLFRVPGAAADNAQLGIRDAARLAARFRRHDFMDLLDFAKLVRAQASIPACAKTGAAEIVNLLEGRTVTVARVRGSAFPPLGGLSIYFPMFRVGKHVLRSTVGVERPTDPYDRPSSRTVDGNTAIAIYQSNHDQLPLRSRDMETNADLNPRTQWPSLPSPVLRFANDTAWSRFLERYYHPTADNKIVKGIAPNGDEIQPVTEGGGDCSNSFDTIAVPVGSKVQFTAIGGSDADMPIGVTVPTAAAPAPPYHIWDFDASKPCERECRAPFEVGTGSDAAISSTDNVDADTLISNSTIDDKDAMGAAAEFTCAEPGKYTVTLHTWDDNHTFAFHNTVPNAAYVHPQSNAHQSVVDCRAASGLTFTGFDPPPGVHIQEQVNISLTGPPLYPVSVRRTGTAPVTANGASVPAAGLEVVTGPNGEIVLLGSPTQTGANTITVRPAGSANPRVFTFDAIARPFSLPTELTVSLTPELGTNRINILVSATRNEYGSSRTGADGVLIHFFVLSGPAVFTNGTRFAGNRGTQFLTGDNGQARAIAEMASPGTAQFRVTALRLSNTFSFTRPGTVSPDPIGLTITGAPRVMTPGQEATIVAQVARGAAVLSGSSVQIQVVRGKATLQGAPPQSTSQTLTTDAQGRASFRIRADEPEPLEIRVTVTGEGGTSQSITIPVLLPPA